VNQDKLWHRIDLDGFNAVKSDVVMKRIAGPHRPFSTQESFLTIASLTNPVKLTVDKIFEKFFFGSKNRFKMSWDYWGAFLPSTAFYSL